MNPIALPSFVLGYHGCECTVGENILAGRDTLHASDRRKRGLDCAMMNYVAEKLLPRLNSRPDTIRAVFLEGPELYPTAGFREKNHIQICVKNSASIVGYFRIPNG